MCGVLIFLGYTYIGIICLVILYKRRNSVLVILTKFYFFREKDVTFLCFGNLIYIEGYIF